MKKALVVFLALFVVVPVVHAHIIGQEQARAAMERAMSAKPAGWIDFDNISTREAMQIYREMGYGLQFEYWKAHAPADSVIRVFYGSYDTKVDARAEGGSFYAKHVATVPGVYLFALENCTSCVSQAQLLATEASGLAERVYALRGPIDFDIDGDKNVYVVIYPFEGEESKWGGCVWYNDMQPLYYGSNGAEIIHLNAYYTHSIETLRSIFAHELTHIVDMSRDFREKPWTMEGFAEDTVYQLGYRQAEINFFPPLADDEFLQKWEKGFRQYEAAFHFIRWFEEFYGKDAGRRLFRDARNGEKSVLAILNEDWHNSYTWADVWHEYRFCRRADFTGDFRVDTRDEIVMLDRMRDNSTDPKYDLDGDGVVSYSDLLILTNHQLASPSILYGQATVPDMEVRTYPNPFTATATISFPVQRRGIVVVRVVNVKGQIFTTLYDGVADQGTATVEWDGSGASAGVYLVQVLADGQSATGKLTFVK